MNQKLFLLGNLGKMTNSKNRIFFSSNELDYLLQEIHWRKFYSNLAGKQGYFLILNLAFWEDKRHRF